MYQPTGPALSLEEFAVRWASRGGLTYHDLGPKASSSTDDDPSMPAVGSSGLPSQVGDLEASDAFTIAVEHRPWSEMRQYLLNSLQKESEAAAASAAATKAAADRLRERKEAEDAAKNGRMHTTVIEDPKTTTTVSGKASAPKPHVAFDSPSGGSAKGASKGGAQLSVSLPKAINTLAIRESVRSLLG
eukprot:PhF_6_TR17492/c0_g1_i1/m.26698